MHEFGSHHCTLCQGGQSAPDAAKGHYIDPTRPKVTQDESPRALGSLESVFPVLILGDHVPTSELSILVAETHFWALESTPTDLFVQSEVLRVKYPDGLMPSERMGVAHER